MRPRNTWTIKTTADGQMTNNRRSAMTAAQEMFHAADKIQHKPLTDAQWSDAVEC